MSEKEQFRDKFTVTVVEPDGKKFDRVKRIVARSEELEMNMQLDINTEIYPMHVGEKFSMALASTLNLDGTPDSGYFMQGGRKSLADEFEYVMQGKLYKISDKKNNGKVDMLASFGGLLMHLEGDIGVSAKFELDQRLFILIKKI